MRKILAPILEMDADVLQERMERNMFEDFLKRKVDDDVARAVKELNLPGIRTTIESKRFYPHGNLASHVLGFVRGSMKAWKESNTIMKRPERGRKATLSMRPTLGRNCPTPFRRICLPLTGMI